MIAPDVAADEIDRLRALTRLEILDTPVEDRYDRIVRLAARAIEVPIAYISFIDENRQWLKANVGMPVCETDRSISFCGHAILEDEPLVIPDARQDERFVDNPMVVGEPFIRFYVGVPLKSGNGHNVGTLCVADSAPRELPAVQLAMLVEFATLVERELQLVDVIEAQRQLLELQSQLDASRARMAGELAQAANYVHSQLPTPRAQPVQIDWRHRPSAQLGGDIFDYFDLDNGNLAVYLLDVSGHGVGAALLSISVMNILRARALPSVDFGDPAAVLTALNRAFPMRDHGNKYFTMWYAVYDAESRTITHALGGHPPPLHVRAGDGKRQASPLTGRHGLMVGALPDSCYENVRVPLSEACEIYAFSDGVYELFEPGDEEATSMLGYDGFAALLERSDGHDLDLTLERLRAFCGDDGFSDDVSLLRLRLP